MYDCIILGDGVVGLALAADLATSLKKIALIRPTVIKIEPKTTYDLRLYAITPESENYLKNSGVWSLLPPEKINPFYTMKVWDDAGGTELKFDSTEVGKPNLGHMIEHTVLMQALFENLKTKPNVHIIQDELENMDVLPSHVILKMQSQQDLETLLLIGADGAHSWIRNHLEIPQIKWDYDHDAIVCVVESEVSHHRTAFQCFQTQGPVAFLPYDDLHHGCIVWSSTRAHAKSLFALEDAAFTEALEKIFLTRLGHLTLKSPRRSFPLKMAHAKEYCKPRVVLCGDAIHTIHPLAGQGANLGLSDVKTLGDVLKNTYQKSDDIGSYACLRRYERARKGDVWKMIGAMEFFKQFFAITNKPTVWLRNKGLQFVNATPILKRFFIRQTQQ